VDDRKEVLPLRVVAARFISTEDQAGLAELDRITAEAWRVIQKRYWLLSTAFTATASATVATLLSGIALTWSETPGAEIVTLIGLGCFGSMLAVAASWRSPLRVGYSSTRRSWSTWPTNDDSSTNSTPTTRLHSRRYSPVGSPLDRRARGAG